MSNSPFLEKQSLSNLRPREDISLTDLAVILLLRWKTVILTTLIITGLAALYIVLSSPEYRYTSLYSVARQAPEQGNSEGYLQPPNALANIMQSAYLPQAKSEIYPNLTALNFSVDISTPSDTGIVMIESQGSEKNSDEIFSFHKNVLDKTLVTQEERLERRLGVLSSQLEQARDNLESAQQQPDTSGIIIQDYASLVAERELKISQLEQGQAIQVAQQSFESVSMGRAVIIILGLIIGGLIGVLMAFLMEFATTVSKSLRDSVHSE